MGPHDQILALNLAELARDVAAWHADRWSTASDALVGLKLCEETGEVADAIAKGGDVLGECADVILVALAVAARFGSPDEIAERTVSKLRRNAASG